MGIKKNAILFAAFFIAVVTTGCTAQSERLPPADTDCISVADECVRDFQELFLKYLQFETYELPIKINKDSSTRRQDIFFYYPVVDDEIKCYSDLKDIVCEYCTDEYAEELLNDAFYRDFDGKLYKADSEKGTASKASFGCYISDCLLDGNIMTVEFTEIGADNELFNIDTEIYDRSPAHDMYFKMTLLWENERWLISDCEEAEDKIGYAYRPDITEAMR